MIPLTRYLLGCIGLLLCVQAQAVPPDDQEGCYWLDDDGRPPGPLYYTSNLGTRYIPRDAPIGTPITLKEVRLEEMPALTPKMRCYKHFTQDIFHLNMVNSEPLFQGVLPPIDDLPLAGKVINTSIPGVGVYLRFDGPYEGRATNEWRPIGGIPVAAPFVGIIDHQTGFFVDHSLQRFWLTLIKTGPIPAGVNHFDSRPLITGTASMVGMFFQWKLQGTLIQNQCSVPANPVNAAPVQLGTWDRRDFTGPDFTTTAVPFQIDLSDCQDNPENNVTTAHIRLDGTKGSVPIDPQRGIFSLTSDSSATGLGIQMLMADGITPVPLGQDVPLGVIPTSGNTSLPFRARYYQTGASSDVRPGSAKGALNFTITYH